MILPSGCKPQLVACGPRDKRPILASVYYEKAKHCITVTNGRSLIRLPVTQDDDDTDGAIIPIDAIKEALRIKGLPAILVKDGKAALLDGRSWPLLNAVNGDTPPATYLDCDRVLPRPETWPRKVRLRVNAELLNNLQQAAAGDNVLLEFNIGEDGDADIGPISVATGKATVAVLMPMELGARYPDRGDSVNDAHDAALVELSAQSVRGDLT